MRPLGLRSLPVSAEDLRGALKGMPPDRWSLYNLAYRASRTLRLTAKLEALMQSLSPGTEEPPDEVQLN